jgi:hypothetical protein
MTLDEPLLKKAQTLAAHVAEAERQAQVSRAEYHDAIRRLHLGGGSLREIAQALGLSHQRVQQMVSSAGGTWWQRVWHSRSLKRDTICTFCRRPPSEVARLIAGPNVYICDACVARAEKVAGEGSSRDGMAPARSVTARCSFCRRRRRAERLLIAAPAATICSECLRLCRQILDDRAA